MCKSDDETTRDTRDPLGDRGGEHLEHAPRQLRVLEQLREPLLVLLSTSADRLWVLADHAGWTETRRHCSCLEPTMQGLKNAKGIIKFEETVSKAHEKRNMHNTRSRSPR